MVKRGMPEALAVKMSPRPRLSTITPAREEVRAEKEATGLLARLVAKSALPDPLPTERERRLPINAEVDWARERPVPEVIPVRLTLTPVPVVRVELVKSTPVPVVTPESTTTLPLLNVLSTKLDELNISPA